MEHENKTPENLYWRISKYFQNVSEFVKALYCLFILNKIEISNESEALHLIKEY
ncbi:ABC-three component system middle component 7 [Apilactobacillus kunkeei]|uniref:ABC-three component system middle component 7 n=1 Tax=Apilactobacillus kunkeei TaxID=148814 RepID=UPI003D048228